METPPALVDSLLSTRTSLLGLVTTVRNNLVLIPPGREYDQIVNNFLISGDSMIAWTDKLLGQAHQGIDLDWIEDCAEAVQAFGDYRDAVSQIEMICQVAHDLEHIETV